MINQEIADALRMADAVKRAMLHARRYAGQRTAPKSVGGGLNTKMRDIHNTLANVGRGGRQKDARRVAAVLRFCDEARAYIAASPLSGSGDWKAQQVLNAIRQDVGDGHFGSARHVAAQYLGIEAVQP